MQHPGVQQLMMIDIHNLKAFVLFLQKTDIKFDLFSLTKEIEKQVFTVSFTAFQCVFPMLKTFICILINFCLYIWLLKKLLIDLSLCLHLYCWNDMYLQYFRSYLYIFKLSWRTCNMSYGSSNCWLIRYTSFFCSYIGPRESRHD